LSELPSLSSNNEKDKKYIKEEISTKQEDNFGKISKSEKWNVTSVMKKCDLVIWKDMRKYVKEKTLNQSEILEYVKNVIKNTKELIIISEEDVKERSNWR
jgi:uncharacterized protein YdaT